MSSAKSDEPARVSLELAPGDGPIAGRLSDGKSTLTFSGWLALAAALEGARRKARPEDGVDPEGRGYG